MSVPLLWLMKRTLDEFPESVRETIPKNGKPREIKYGLLSENEELPQYSWRPQTDLNGPHQAKMDFIHFDLANQNDYRTELYYF